MKSRRHRATFRASHARYRWRLLGRGLFLWTQRAFFLGLAAWLGSLGYAAWTRAEWLRVRNVEVAPGAPEGLAGRVGVSAGDHLFGFKAREVEARLRAAYPELALARVRRSWDGSVRVAVGRRAAAAKVFRDGEWFGMDAAGALFPLRLAGTEDAPPDDPAARRLIILAGVPEGEAALPALAFARRIQSLTDPWARRFYKMKLLPGGETALFLKDGPPVTWGPLDVDEARVKAKSARLDRVLRHPALAGGAEYARFVDDRRIAVKPKERGAKGEK